MTYFLFDSVYTVSVKKYLPLTLSYSDLDSNREDSDSRSQDLYSDSEHYKHVMLSHITSCIETVYFTKFSGRLVSIFSTPYLGRFSVQLSIQF